MICANQKCARDFDPADRASAITPPGSAVQIKYCSVACAKAAANRRYYLAHRAAMIARVQARRAKTK